MSHPEGSLSLVFSDCSSHYTEPPVIKLDIIKSSVKMYTGGGKFCGRMTEKFKFASSNIFTLFDPRFPDVKFAYLNHQIQFEMK